MNRNVNPRQFTRVYRGLNFGEGSPKDIESFHRNPRAFINPGRANAGIHWTDNENSAYNFATDKDPEGWAHESFDEPTGHTFGVVLHGKVRDKHIIPEGSEEHENYSMSDAILGHDHPENEVTIRDNAPVRMHHITAYSVSPEGHERYSEHSYGRVQRA